MFVCRDCGGIFEEPHVEYESRGEFWGAPALEAMGYCPYCRGESYSEYMEEDEDGED